MRAGPADAAKRSNRRAARVHEQQHHREDQREDDRSRLAARADDRAPRERSDLWPGVAHRTGSAASASASAAPSSDRPVLARKTSSSEGAWISRLARVRPASSTARTTAGSPANPSCSLTATSPARRRLAVRRARPRAARDRLRSRGSREQLGGRSRPEGLQVLGDDVPVVDDPGRSASASASSGRQEDGHAVLVGEARDLVPEGRAALDVKPVVGSSRKMIRGRCTSAAPDRAGASSRRSSRRHVGRLARADAVEQLLRAWLPRGGNPLQRRLQA